MVGLGLNEDFRPDGWRETAQGVLKHEIPFIRDVALRNLPLPLDEATATIVNEAIQDDFAPVQGAACDLAGKARLKEFGPSLVKILENTQNEWLMRGAFDAAKECGVNNDERLEICLRRMKPRDNEWNMLMLSLLIDGTIKTSGYGSRAIDNWSPILPGIRKAWLEFIAAHRQELREGKRFDVGDPPLSRQMLPPEFRLDRKGQPPWPEG
jgi:hypothetical protein